MKEEHNNKNPKFYIKDKSMTRKGEECKGKMRGREKTRRKGRLEIGVFFFVVLLL